MRRGFEQGGVRAASVRCLSLFDMFQSYDCYSLVTLIIRQAKANDFPNLDQGDLSRSFQEGVVTDQYPRLDAERHPPDVFLPEAEQPSQRRRCSSDAQRRPSRRRGPDKEVL